MSAPDYTKIENPTTEWRKEELERRSQLSRADFYKEVLPIIQAVANGAEVEELDLLKEDKQNWCKPTGNVLAPTTPNYVYRIKQQPQPKWIPWTLDTAPEELIWVRPNVNDNYRYFVTGFGPSGVTAGSGFCISYSELLSDYEFAYRFDLSTWYICGTLTDPKLNENKS